MSLRRCRTECEIVSSRGPKIIRGGEHKLPPTKANCLRLALCRIILAGARMAPAINPFRLLSEFIVFLLGALLIVLAFSGRAGLPTRPAALIALGAFLVFWGVRAGNQTGTGAAALRVENSRHLAGSGRSICSRHAPGSVTPGARDAGCRRHDSGASWHTRRSIFVAQGLKLRASQKI